MEIGLFAFKSLAAFSLVLLASVQASAADSGCWDPSQEPAINELFQAKSIYKKAEDQKTIELIHDTIWSHREEIDPRLVYHRIVGESKGDPLIMSPDKKYYGLFQFSVNQKATIEARYRKNPRVSPRLIQIQYYLDTYMQRFIRDANQNRGCKPDKKWSQYTNLEKSVYLNQGRCNDALLRHEREYCTPKSKNTNYRNLACKFSLAATNGRGKRLCERQNPGVRSVPAPASGPRRGSGSGARK